MWPLEHVHLRARGRGQRAMGTGYLASTPHSPQGTPVPPSPGSSSLLGLRPMLWGAAACGLRDATAPCGLGDATDPTGTSRVKCLAGSGAK